MDQGIPSFVVPSSLHPRVLFSFAYLKRASLAVPTSGPNDHSATRVDRSLSREWRRENRRNQWSPLHSGPFFSPPFATGLAGHFI